MRTRAALARRFQVLMERIQPTPAELERLARHRATVVQRLTSVMNALAPVAMGSYTRKTAITRFSDFDLLLPLRASEVKWGDGLKTSDTVINNVRTQLNSRFYQSDIGRDGQAIVVSFSDGIQIDVVPAYFRSFNQVPVYGIADGARGWMETSPVRHNKYIADADSASGRKLKRVAQVVKFWRFTRGTPVPMSSFHFELLLASTGVCAGVKTYSECVKDAMALLSSRQARALQDPVGISGWVTAANTSAKRDSLAASAKDSAAHACWAYDAEQRGDTEEAVRQWNIVFNDCFPRN